MLKYGCLIKQANLCCFNYSCGLISLLLSIFATELFTVELFTVELFTVELFTVEYG
ncbi:hypothetical protein GCM10009409_34830 [Shewanella saliphila]|uniref:Uncharacterized protein n=1 Tax=Shewanella saliphila TaxID=2282698 RepID=A0ABQ2QA48_9GAMM|nr:hypothetical protein GCM10009409_34830 [Shewanella saliphila]